MFELVWESEAAAAGKSKVRSWEPISHITGGYASPLVQKFVRECFLQPVAAGKKRNAATSAKKTCRKRGRLAAPASDQQAAAAPEPVAAEVSTASASAVSAAAAVTAATAAAAVAVHVAAEEQPAAAESAALPIQLESVDSQALTVRRQSSVLRQPSQRLSRSSSQCGTGVAAAARRQVEQLALVAAGDAHISAADLKFFNDLADLLFPPLSRRAESAAATAALVTRASSMLSQATQGLAATH